MRQIVAFDLDRTLTRHDTLWLFMRLAASPWRLAWCLLLSAPRMVLARLGICDRGRAKEALLSRILTPKTDREIGRLGIAMADVVEADLRPDARTLLEQYRAQDATIYVVSASPALWIEPWARKRGIEVIATGMARNDRGRIAFTTPNCNGPEKVRRLLEREPDRASYHLTAYGDSRGDKPLLALADSAHYRAIH